MAKPEMRTETLPAVPASVPRARGAVAHYARRAGATEEQVEDIRLVVSEAVTNAVIHAYRADAVGEVRIGMAVAGDELWLLVSDDGAGLRPRSDSPGLGIGLTLIAKLSQEFGISRPSGGGTEVRMRFPIPGGTPEHVEGEPVRRDTEIRRTAATRGRRGSQPKLAGRIGPFQPRG